jgi:hypothetical protein
MRSAGCPRHPAEQKCVLRDALSILTHGGESILTPKDSAADWKIRLVSAVLLNLQDGIQGL